MPRIDGGVPVARQIRNAIYGTRLYGPARAVHQALFDRSTFRYRSRMKSFYGQFIRKGDLVFDVGANIGEYSELFASLGATVVAVEPNPSCCQSLFRLARMNDVRVEGCAVGRSTGTATLRVCDHSIFSTLSDEWYENTLSAATYKNVHWVDTLEVPVVSLDLLARRHGTPAFVKVDVEGFEENVIEGMSFAPIFLSFEFSNVRREVALNCIAKLASKGYEFNPMLGREFAFQFPAWRAGRETESWLRAYRGEEEFGDIFARTARQPAS